MPPAPLPGDGAWQHLAARSSRPRPAVGPPVRHLVNCPRPGFAGRADELKGRRRGLQLVNWRGDEGISAGTDYCRSTGRFGPSTETPRLWRSSAISVFVSLMESEDAAKAARR